MTRIVKATHVAGRILRLEFSDGSSGEHDLQPLIDHDTELTRPLRDEGYFRSFFLELGALCWPNGLELSAESLQRKLRAAGLLRTEVRVA